MPASSVILESAAVKRALNRIAHEIAERNVASAEVALVGIQRGGVFLARRLSGILQAIWNHPIPVGELDVSMHRDDLDRHASRIKMLPTVIPFDIAGKTVILVDDVLFSGRTVRAALDALHDFGRPRRVQLAVLVDRGSRELPITADFVGKEYPVPSNERIEVRFQEEGGADQVMVERS
ncbi:MAG TPA: bifunctional pyr operon transcriptional regulator/uracil phosphoribosyltransferase PyrR [Verrucomicrobiae bacterium]|jgi:pyrimidine operon attenuation protein/uracil phosphoribosyltransferase